MKNYPIHCSKLKQSPQAIKKWVVYFLGCILFFSAKAQDPHFTQYQSSPLLLNPTLTGFFNGDVRMSGVYRNQWQNIATPFTTGSFSVDANVLKGVIRDGDILGIGFTGMFDASNNGGLKVNSLSASLGYNFRLDGEGVNRVGVGFMASHNSKIVDYSKFTFGQQLTVNGFNINLPTGEARNGMSLNYMDYAAGILYSAITDYSSFTLGASMYHVNNRIQTTSIPLTQTQARYVVHTGGYMQLDDLGKLHLSAAYMKSEQMQEVIFGAAYSRTLSPNLDDNFNFLFGSFYRYNDAVSPYIGLEYGNLRGGLSYDINVSSLSTASRLRGGFELSLSFLFTRNPEENALKQTLCPKGGSQLRWFGY